MQRFRGQSEHSLDPRGRLNIPARFRDVLREQYDSDTLIATHWKNCLKVYPLASWEAAEEKLIRQVDEGNMPKDFGRFVRYLIAGVTECPLDKQGRILIPPTLRDGLNIGRDVMLNGMLHHFEIWDKAAWQEEAKSARESFEEFSAGLAIMGML